MVEQLGKRVALLEGELRAAKRRETKLAATHFRLRQDIASADGDLKCAAAIALTEDVHASEGCNVPGTLAGTTLLLYDGQKWGRPRCVCRSCSGRNSQLLWRHTCHGQWSHPATETGQLPLCTCRAFDKLKEVRQLEYELDFAQNRARRDLTALQAKLDAMTARYADFASGTWH